MRAIAPAGEELADGAVVVAALVDGVAPVVAEGGRGGGYGGEQGCWVMSRGGEDFCHHYFIFFPFSPFLFFFFAT